MLVSKSKRWLKKALVRSSILPAASRFFAPAAAILAYHSVVEEPQRTDYILGSSRSRVEFERHMETLVRKFSSAFRSKNFCRKSVRAARFFKPK